MMDLGTRQDRFRQADLYVVITEAFCDGRSGLDVLDGCLRAGVRLVQFREKNTSDQILVEKGTAFADRCREAGALLIVNDRVDIALAIGADGVHLGQDDLPIGAARRIAPDLLVGASSHNLDEAMVAQAAGATYVNIGPIFDTQTKDVPTGVVGPDMIDTIRPHLNIPFTCMGGLKAHNLHAVVERGTRRVAVVTAVTAAPDVKAAARELRKAIHAAG
ncbi:MAG: thiamine phosphate synthase [Candidatus Hydrogenedentes bacterium]|nr:thiamine phosphate synthase [Candidatus Hydrogenedentota bacterium]